MQMKQFQDASAGQKQEIMVRSLMGLRSVIDAKVDAVSAKIQAHTDEDRTWKDERAKEMKSLSERMANLEG